MMNKSQILKKIGVIIQELNEQHQYLTNTNKINLLELELFTANADFLIDHIEILKKINSYIPEAEQAETVISTPPISQRLKKEGEISPVAKVFPFSIEGAAENSIKKEDQPKIEEEEKEDKRYFDFSFDKEPTDMVFDFERKISVDQVFDRELSEKEKQVLKEKEEKTGSQVIQEKEEKIEEKVEIVKEDEIEEEPYILIKNEVKQEPLIENPQTIAPISEKKEGPFVDDHVPPVMPQPQAIVTEEKRPTLNEMLSAKLGHQSSNITSGSKPVSDLKTAISINDKMVFIKELFNGYNLAYSEAIEIINRFESFEAADNFLMKNYAKKNDWENKTATVERFYDYLNRKFIK